MQFHFYLNKNIEVPLLLMILDQNIIFAIFLLLRLCIVEGYPCHMVPVLQLYCNKLYTLLYCNNKQQENT